MASFTAANQGNGIFSPAIWSKELIIARESVLVMANNVLRLDSDVAENGYVINLPSISNLSAGLIGADGSCADQAPSETATTLTVDQWYGVTINVPDILAVQSKYDLMKLYSEKMGYALGVIVEQKLLGKYADSSTNYVGTAATDITDAVLRFKSSMRRVSPWLRDTLLLPLPRSLLCWGLISSFVMMPFRIPRVILLLSRETLGNCTEC